MKLVHIVGNRPQFIKLSPILKATGGYKEIENIILHSGQHYDYNMSRVFFDELGIPEPDYNLEVGSGTHGIQTGKMLMGLDRILLKEKPNCVIVYGDTNTTLAGALASYKLHYPCAHVESGMREYIWRPEEMNKKIADHCSNFLFCPLERAVNNLINEGIPTKKIYLTGDVTYDAYLMNSKKTENSVILKNLNLDVKEYILLTMHRAETVDNYEEVVEILKGLREINELIIFPIHPRTENRLKEYGLLNQLKNHSNIRLIKPVGYFEFLKLLNNSQLVITDSSGVIKETFFAKKPGITIDYTTEYKEIFELGYNILAGKTKKGIFKSYKERINKNLPDIKDNPLGDGNAAEKMVKILFDSLGDSS
jgi:UDP-N-acetylglucosamine 2-epimerase (non-hydrolysing)